MFVRVLGAAAGGGFPQWNCRCAGCTRARAGDKAVRPRTQASLAVSADGRRWVLLNASPDLPSQLRAAPALQPDPDGPARNCPVQAVVLSGGDIDCIAGLLSLREGHAFTLYAEAFVQEILNANQIFSVLNPDIVRFATLARGHEMLLRDAPGESLGLWVEVFAVPGKIPLYQEAGLDAAALVSTQAVVGLALRDAAGHRLYFIPGCARVTDELRARLQDADLLFFDGTLWRDNEMIEAGLSTKTGARMGHISVSGPQGSIAAWAGSRIARKILIHINNTNPILCEDSVQAAEVRATGWEIAYDGMEITL
jgi:pyrroloquinoline quinone biosynthesis protein B